MEYVPCDISMHASMIMRDDMLGLISAFCRLITWLAARLPCGDICNFIHDSFLYLCLLLYRQLSSNISGPSIDVGATAS